MSVERSTLISASETPQQKEQRLEAYKVFAENFDYYFSNNNFSVFIYGPSDDSKIDLENWHGSLTLNKITEQATDERTGQVSQKIFRDIILEVGEVIMHGVPTVVFAEDDGRYSITEDDLLLKDGKEVDLERTMRLLDLLIDNEPIVPDDKDYWENFVKRVPPSHEEVEEALTPYGDITMRELIEACHYGVVRETIMKEWLEMVSDYNAIHPEQKEPLREDDPSLRPVFHRIDELNHPINVVGIIHKDQNESFVLLKPEMKSTPLVGQIEERLRKLKTSFTIKY